MGTVNQPDLIRMDNNILLNGLDFVKMYGTESSLIFDIVLYNARNYQKNLFAFQEFDIDHFAEKFNYSKSNLLRKHPAPFWDSSEISTQGIEKFTSVIDDSLLRMYLKPLVFSNVVYDMTTGTKTIKLEKYELIKNLEKHINKRKDSYKYTFQIDPFFKKHMNWFYTDMDINSAINLRKSKSVFLYLKFLSLRKMYFDGVINEVTPSFDELCRLAQLEVKNLSDLKKRLKTKMSIIQERTNLNFKTEFYKKSGKYNFGVKLHFEDAPETNYESIKQACLDEVIDTLIEIYKELYKVEGKLDMHEFKVWLNNPELNLELKLNTYFSVLSNIKKLKIEDVTRHERTNAMKLFKAYKGILKHYNTED